MRLPGPDDPYCLFDDARAQGAAPARLYRDPVDTVVAHAMADVELALDRIGEARERGLHAAGYLTYEAGLALSGRLSGLSRARGSGAPLLWFGLFEGVRLVPPGDVAGLLPDPTGASVQALRPLIDRENYAAAFNSVQELIRAGDIYQANLTFPCDVDFSGDPVALYAGLRGRARAGYGGVIRTGAQDLLSFSPELFFTLVRGQLTARPMKGTAVCLADPVADAEAARMLALDEKQRAENLMIVDLLRNDLSRVALAGSVTVPELFRVESYPTVHQMVSTIRARLLPGLSAVDALRMLYPCGSITGAPKMRAMEIIDVVEAGARGVYTGAMGWIDPDGDAAFNVAIRTLTVRRGESTGRLGLGSGIVADSQLADEWDECLAKGRFLSKA